jgi:hypothetical protein
VYSFVYKDKEMKYERTQKGNPHDLIINQHIFPRKSIARFTNNKVVQVFLRDKNATFSATPGNAIFCVSRTWDQRAERGYMKDIEDRFQCLADELSERTRILSDSENSVISDFYLLWYFRFYYSITPIQDQKLPGITGSRLTKDQEEILESRYVSFVRSNGFMPARFMNSGYITILMQRFKAGQFENLKWGVIESNKEEYIVPDYFWPYMVVPLTPLKCFIANETNKLATPKNITAINKIALSNYKRYYFGRFLKDCLGIE